MENGRDFLFFFSALGAFNSLLVGGYLLVVRKQFSRTYLWLSLLLLFISIRTGLSSLYYFDNVPKELIKLGLSANLLIGSSLFNYVRYSIDSKIRLRSGLFHLLLVTLLLLTLSLVFGFQTWDFLIRYSIHALLTMYLMLSGIILTKHLKLQSFNWRSSIEQGPLTIYVGVMLMCIIYAISLFTDYILGPLLYSVIFHGFMLQRLYYKPKSSIGPKNQYHRKLPLEDVAIVKDRLEKLMVEQKPYLDAQLTLDKLSSLLSVSRHFLSQMLNDNMNMGYKDLINRHRIEEACSLIEKRPHFNLDAIAYEVGFNSKSTFYTLFKKLKGVTPSQYRAQILV